MKKFKITGMYTDYIYAESQDEALEQFDELNHDLEPFDEIIVEEIKD